MKGFARILVYVLGALTVFGAFGFMFNPTGMLENFAVNPTRVEGWGTIRSDLGGPFLGIACFAFVGAQAGKANWLLVPVVFMATFLVGRTIHFALDGVSQAGLFSYGLEVVMLGAFEWARRVLSKD